MLYTYPANKLENLVTVLDTLLTTLERPPLASDAVLVQHPGMQHWLSMELAKRSTHSISMNIEFPLPVRYFWDLIRLILGPGIVPERSVYTREILAWRLYLLLAREDVQQSELMREPTQYWQNQPDFQQAARRFQLAEQLADLYEQYLMFRPEWIEQWEQQPAGHWQALLWQQLVKEDPNHPLTLMKRANQQVQQTAQALPEQFFIFGINALAPIWIDFLANLAEQTGTDIHLLYLNPSAEHWDDLQSDKQRIREQIKHQQAGQRAQWVETDELTQQSGNPLLTSLGQQGQAFVRLLSDRAHYDAHAYSQPTASGLLAQVQNDLLQVQDAREHPQTLQPDNSLLMTSAHSAFREVQGLHDWLLHQFNKDDSLTPKDVLVMCPNVEDYAPFVQAVFARSFADIPDEVPPLPCSIADRNLKDADPTVAAFLELLTLPDARFEVSQLLSWLRVPAIADKFSLTPSDLQRVSQWLEHACVHWGLDANHKQRWTDAETTQHFTWKQGLDRLLLGFAYGDQDALIDDQLWLHDVEGANALILGKVASIIEQLQNLRSELTKARTPEQWQQYLIEQLQIALLSSQSEFERSNQSILKAINDVTEFANRAQLQATELPLSVVRYVLESAFASPEQTGSQFMTGQITVCSMVPMRSIPFRIIAILGLNDGEFPRNRPPMGFDLMASDTPRLGDRSRRGDDRYLFLEALLSARDSLYLSYQGLDIRKNEPRPPSLVLEELIDYLHRGYGFDRDKHIRVMPLQPFSDKNYQGDYPSFEDHWAHLQTPRAQSTTLALTSTEPEKNEWSIAQWLSFFAHPAKYFANHRLGLYLDDPLRQSLSDSEPFALNNLDRYTIQDDAIEHFFANAPHSDFYTRALAASKMPLSEIARTETEQWQQQAMDFAELVASRGVNERQTELIQFETHDFLLSENLQLTADRQLLSWRLANLKGKDIVQMWLRHLLANTQYEVTSHHFYRGKNDAVERLTLAPIDGAGTELQKLFTVMQNGLMIPSILHSDMLMLPLTEKANEKDFAALWDKPFLQQGLSYDAYMQHFWPEQPEADATLAELQAVYSSLFRIATLTVEEFDHA